MKRLILTTAAVASVQFASLGTAMAAPEIGANLCQVDGQPVKFERSPEFGSRSIIRGHARLDEKALLLYNFNPFYDIGGRIILHTGKGSTLLLLWGSEHSDPITQGAVSYEGRRVECKLP